MTKRTKQTALDKITDKLRAALRNENAAITRVGNLPRESRLHLDHGDWMSWLEDNFDLSYRTAIRYIRAAEYCDGKSAMVANLAPSVLYRLAESAYSPAEEDAILARAKCCRVNVTKAEAICDELNEATPASGKGGAVLSDIEPATDEGFDPDAILDGSPPELPPPEPPASVDFVLPAFDQAISKLKELSTKHSDKFRNGSHPASDIDEVAKFLFHVASTKAKAAA
jgi:hypothetical protein